MVTVVYVWFKYLQKQSQNNISQRKKTITKPWDNHLNGTEYTVETLCTHHVKFQGLVSSLEIDLLLSCKDWQLAFSLPHPVIRHHIFFSRFYHDNLTWSVKIRLNRNHFLPQLVLVVLLGLYWRHQAFFLGPVKMYDEIICLSTTLRRCSPIQLLYQPLHIYTPISSKTCSFLSRVYLLPKFTKRWCLMSDRLIYFFLIILHFSKHVQDHYSATKRG